MSFKISIISGFLLAMNMGSASYSVELLDVVEQVDLNLYLGKWYEVARLDNRFQKNCMDSIAEYSFREDGDLKVLNSCQIENKTTRK